MVFTYTVDKDIFSALGSENEIDLFLSKANHFFDVVHKRAIWLDCHEAGMSNQIVKMCLELRELIDNINIRWMFEAFYMKYFFNKEILIPSSCVCPDSNKCNISDNTQCLINKNFNISFVLTTKAILISSTEIINMQNFYKSRIFIECSKTSCIYSNLPPSNLNEGILIMESYWTDIIKLCKKSVTLIDRNVFEKWDQNYKDGITQYSRLISKVNPNISFRIISRKQNNLNGDLILPQIKQFISSITSPKIIFQLCDKTRGAFSHSRHIMFYEHIGAKLEKGLDTFVPNNQGDKIDVTYTKIDEVREIRKDALSTLISEGKFKEFSNR